MRLKQPSPLPSALTRLPVALLVLLLALALVGAVRGADDARAASRYISDGTAVTASSTAGSAYAASNAVDGSLSTRWAGASTSPQWITIDLGAQAKLAAVSLKWDAAYAKAFRLQLSTDGASWSTAYSTQKGAGGTQNVGVGATARYVRMLGLVRGTPWGYSLREFSVVGTFVTPPSTTPPSTPTTGVHVTGTRGDWQLSVDGAPYFVKGLTYDPENTASQAMPDLQSMGVNTIRTWGTDSSSGTVFDAASAHGIRVIAGFWLEPGADYVNDSSYKASAMANIRALVTKYKSSPGVLMWDVGNEVLVGQSEAQRIAYAKYLEQVVKAIHAIDPDHPVTSTDAWTGSWAYYKAYTPSLDLYTVNTYGGVSYVKSDWQKGGYTKPYIVTETGPAGDWEVAKDANGVPVEPTDQAKAAAYTTAWNDVVADPGVALGATMFNYGPENDWQGIWLNVCNGSLKRLSYYAVKQAYTGQSSPDTPPVFSTFTTPTATIARGSSFAVTVAATDPQGDPVAYSFADSSHYIDGSNAVNTLAASGGSAGHYTLTAPTIAGSWKIYAYAKDGHGNVGIESRTITVR